MHCARVEIESSSFLMKSPDKNWNLSTSLDTIKKEDPNDRRHDANCGLFKYAHLNKNHPIPKRFFKNVMHDEFICFGLRL